MIPPDQLELWNKIERFTMDDTTAVINFSCKLATTEGWTEPYVKRAIVEYKRFLFLCCISEKGAAPSPSVDQVWHLHLTYTRSYWIGLCKNTLGRDIHHYPSMGGPEEDLKHRDWYRETWQLYKETFDTEPPADIWPAPMNRKGTERPLVVSGFAQDRALHWLRYWWSSFYLFCLSGSDMQPILLFLCPDVIFYHSFFFSPWPYLSLLSSSVSG